MLEAPRSSVTVNWSAAELAALLDAAVDAIVVIDESGRINAFNPAAEKMFGYSRADVIDQPVSMLMPEPYATEHQFYVERYIHSGQPHVIGRGRDVEGRRSSGESFPISLSIGEARSEGSRRFVGIIRDRTADKEIERSTRSLEARLTHVGRFHLLGEMASGIAHEINQPLSAITMYAEAAKRLMQRDPADLSALARTCDRVADQARRASEVIANLRSFLRKHEVHTEPVDVNSLINDVMKLIEADAHAEGIVVSVQLGEDVPRVNADCIQLQQVVMNLTRNAVDAMRYGLRKKKGIHIRTERADDGGASIEVLDSGHGVPKSLADSIFHPFVTTKQDGLGVGLAISRTIAESYGGTLTFSDNPEGGARFVVRLPSAW
jgi:two-component system, LuxR family, sensor kinase FixL